MREPLDELDDPAYTLTLRVPTVWYGIDSFLKMTSGAPCQYFIWEKWMSGCQAIVYDQLAYAALAWIPFMLRMARRQTPSLIDGLIEDLIKAKTSFR